MVHSEVKAVKVGVIVENNHVIENSCHVHSQQREECNAILPQFPIWLDFVLSRNWIGLVSESECNSRGTDLPGFLLPSTHFLHKIRSWFGWRPGRCFCPVRGDVVLLDDIPSGSERDPF